VILVNTGDGKESTAAFGVVARAVTRGWDVAVVQFMKSGRWNVGEEKVCRDRLGVSWWAIGEGFTWESTDLGEDEATAGEAWRHARSPIESGAHQLVVLDEITYPMTFGWISSDEVVGVLPSAGDRVHVVCTGRDAPEPLVEVSDTVTEMRKVKHAYDRGVRARRGIDF
jgi:cob(I)alamin adenosyltransferase